MAQQSTTGIFDLTHAAPMIYLNLHEARAFKDKNGKEKGDPKYGAMFVLDAAHVDLAGLKSAAKAAANEKWPGVELNTIKWPFQSGAKYAAKLRENNKSAAVADFVDGKVIIKGRSKYAPRLSGIENGRMVDYEGDAVAKSKGKFYSGVNALASFNFVPIEVAGDGDDGPKRYVTCYLNMVFTTGKGDRVGGGGRSAAETFKGYVGASTTEDPTAGGLDDEIPF